MIRLKCVSELLIYKFFKYNTADPKGKETVITMLSLPEDLDYTLTGLSAYNIVALLCEENRIQGVSKKAYIWLIPKFLYFL